ncbi:hypothetical protein LY76DRAFT_236556 [Colletotrichum caudatum]|nr:hypothetical protein LY76DRAFT_236556 [Colletotrichum caudatum]
MQLTQGRRAMDGNSNVRLSHCSRTTPVNLHVSDAPGKSAKPPSTPKEAEVDHVPVGANSQTLRISLVPSSGAGTSLPAPIRRGAVEVGVACVVFWPCCREGRVGSPVACRLCFWYVRARAARRIDFRFDLYLFFFWICLLLLYS